MGVVLWTVREGRVGPFDGPEIMSGYRSSRSLSAPMTGESESHDATQVGSLSR